MSTLMFLPLHKIMFQVPPEVKFTFNDDINHLCDFTFQ